MGSAELRPFRASTFHHTTSKVERGEAQQPTTGRFRQSRRRICRAEIRRTEGVEASALGRETRNTQDNNYYHLRTTQRAFMQRVQRCTLLRVRAGASNLDELMTVEPLPCAPSWLRANRVNNERCLPRIRLELPAQLVHQRLNALLQRLLHLGVDLTEVHPLHSNLLEREGGHNADG